MLGGSTFDPNVPVLSPIEEDVNPLDAEEGQPPPLADESGPEVPEGAPIEVGDDSVAASEDTALTISASQLLENDTDLDGDTLRIVGVDDPAHGSATLNNDGTISYLADENYSGDDSFTYTVTDDNGNFETGVVNVDVAGVEIRMDLKV